MAAGSVLSTDYNGKLLILPAATSASDTPPYTPINQKNLAGELIVTLTPSVTGRPSREGQALVWPSPFVPAGYILPLINFKHGSLCCSRPGREWLLMVLFADVARISTRAIESLSRRIRLMVLCALSTSWRRAVSLGSLPPALGCMI